MAIQKDGVRATTVDDLIKENLRIPHYQRPYSWEPATALQLLDDIRESRKDGARNDVPYILGAVILHAHDDVFDVVDGQQRLLTLRMLIALLDYKSGDGLPQLFASNGDNPVSQVWRALEHRIQPWLHEDRGEFLKYLREKCQLVRIVTDDIDEAFRVFDSQNYRGKPLAPHDLLKAYHLREMRDDTAAMRAAVVEGWESVTDVDLDRLFSIYLYRIARWSRGESAPGFSSHDVGMFKGISPRAALPPSARYHLAAQSAIPLLSAWCKTPSHEDRDAGRTRFQLDAPLVAGRPFFEMVSFMLGELSWLAGEAFDRGKVAFALYNLDALREKGDMLERPSRSRYRYVSELYLAALLYYTNRFGDDDLDTARQRLFAWAYSLRVKNLRVQFRSIDNHAHRESPAFALLRDASTGNVVYELSPPISPYNEAHEVELVKLLRGS